MFGIERSRRAKFACGFVISILLSEDTAERVVTFSIRGTESNGFSRLILGILED